ncbi:MAG: SGNH/GDSL hydrolase family protein [Candidatus Omnitrophica bacterium]|nr:SGNH/GDSL hydrolase family protein [Candidatus Omnitrophota bacterium]
MKKFFIIVLNILLAFALSFVVGNLTNTFQLHKNWETSKLGLAKPVSTSIAFMARRPALAHGVLNLGAWNGYNEVYYRKPILVREINFRAFFPLDSFLAISFNRNDEKSEGVLIGSSYLYRNCYFKAKPSGEFVSQKFLSPFHVEPNRWRTFHLVSENGKVVVYVDGKRWVYKLPTDFALGQIAFRGGEHPVYIDQIEFIGRDGHVMARENFKNPYLPQIFLIAFLIFFLVGILLKRFGDVYILFLQVFLLIVLIIFSAVDFFVASKRYPKYDDKIKVQEENWVLTEERRVYDEIKTVIAATKQENEYRILVLGSSQTWGAGIARRGDEFTSLLEKELNRKIPSKKITVINAGICGSSSKRLYKLYEAAFIDTKPDLVIINLSNNDDNFDEQKFVLYLTRFCELNRRSGIRTAFMLEPNSLEHRFYLPNHPIMRQVALRYNVPILDAQAFLAERHENGFLWWDWVHMSSFGHKLIAEFLTEAIANNHFIPSFF